MFDCNICGDDFDDFDDHMKHYQFCKISEHLLKKIDPDYIYMDPESKKKYLKKMCNQPNILPNYHFTSLDGIHDEPPEVQKQLFNHLLSDEFINKCKGYVNDIFAS